MISPVCAVDGEKQSSLANFFIYFHNDKIQLHNFCRLDPTGRSKGECELLSVPLSHLDIGRDVYPDPDYDYYERDRNAASVNCKQLPSVGYGGSGGGGGLYSGGGYSYGYGGGGGYYADRRYDYGGNKF